MRKLIGTITIFVILYIGFFGCKKYNMKPFIIEWLSSDKPKKMSKKINDIKQKFEDIKIDSIQKINIKL